MKSSDEMRAESFYKFFTWFYSVLGLLSVVFLIILISTPSDKTPFVSPTDNIVFSALSSDLDDTTLEDNTLYLIYPGQAARQMIVQIADATSQLGYDDTVSSFWMTRGFSIKVRDDARFVRFDVWTPMSSANHWPCSVGSVSLVVTPDFQLRMKRGNKLYTEHDVVGWMRDSDTISCSLLLRL